MLVVASILLNWGLESTYQFVYKGHISIIYRGIAMSNTRLKRIANRWVQAA